MAKAGKLPPEETAGKGGRNFVNDGCARGSIDHGNAVEKKCRGEGTEQEILQRGFVGDERAAAETHQHVRGNRTHLQADECGDELIGACQDAHPRGREVESARSIRRAGCLRGRGSRANRESRGRRRL